MQVLSWGPSANSYKFNAGNLTSFRSSVALAQFLTDNVGEDSIIASNANSTVYPNAQIRMGFTGTSTLFGLTRTAASLLVLLPMV